MVIDLGDTYDFASASIPASCGDTRTTIINEYVTYGTPYFPGCTEFTQTLVNPHFTFAQLNSGTYSWAILRGYFTSELDQLYGIAGSFPVASAYRNPAREYVVATSQPNGKYYSGSRHQYGDAVDVTTNSSNWKTYQTYGHQLSACVEPVLVQNGSYAHAHLDWRKQSTLGPIYNSCPQGWE